MAQIPSVPESSGNPDARPAGGRNVGTPRWVKVFGIVALVVVALLLAVALLRPGGHGPAMHGSSGPSESGSGNVTEIHTPPGSA